MTFIINISRMLKWQNQLNINAKNLIKMDLTTKLNRIEIIHKLNLKELFVKRVKKKSRTLNMQPFWCMVRKEVADHLRSWRFVILLFLMLLTCFGSLYASLSGISAGSIVNKEDSFFFLNLFVLSDGTLPSYFVFIGFLGPLIGISLGFDSINSEHSKGTLSRMLAHPIPRDFVLNAKFIAGIILIAVLFFSLSFLTIGIGLVALGIPPTVEEFMRVLLFALLSVVYVSFWLNLAIFFSVKFSQPSTSALSSIAVWLFFTVFYPLIVNVVTKAVASSKMPSFESVYLHKKLKFLLSQIMPNELFSEITSALLMPATRSIGPLTMEQVQGALPGPLPLGQSLTIIWPQLTGIIALTLLCFMFSYIIFMKREIRARR